ncbi:MAG: hypothetical protein AAGA43_05885 [Bacteroidota bacterium]
MKLPLIFAMLFSSLTILGQEFHTEFNYDGSNSKDITIRNSYPKGGLKYTSPTGKEYVYAVFWTSITNNGDSGLELSIDFPVESFTIPSSPKTNFNLYLPYQEVHLEKEHMLNYGLDLKSFLDENIEKPPEVVKYISPNESYLFYVTVLSNQGVDGAVRAGFELQKQKLIYKINNHEIDSGQIKSKK